MNTTYTREGDDILAHEDGKPHWKVASFDKNEKLRMAKGQTEHKEAVEAFLAAKPEDRVPMSETDDVFFHREEDAKAFVEKFGGEVIPGEGRADGFFKVTFKITAETHDWFDAFLVSNPYSPEQMEESDRTIIYSFLPNGDAQDFHEKFGGVLQSPGDIVEVQPGISFEISDNRVVKVFDTIEQMQEFQKDGQPTEDDHDPKWEDSRDEVSDPQFDIVPSGIAERFHDELKADLPNIAPDVPPCPPETPEEGDKAIEVVEWFFEHLPTVAAAKYAGRKIPTRDELEG